MDALEGEGDAARIRFVVVGEDGRAVFADADELDLYGVREEYEHELEAEDG